MNGHFSLEYKYHVLLIFLFAIVFSVNAETSAIEKFDNKFSVGINSSFNFVVFNNQNNISTSNAPAFIGFSFGYKDYSASFNFAFPYTYDRSPGKEIPFDAGLVFYQKHWIEEIKFQFYDDWISADKPFDI